MIGGLNAGYLPLEILLFEFPVFSLGSTLQFMKQIAGKAVSQA